MKMKKHRIFLAAMSGVLLLMTACQEQESSPPVDRTPVSSVAVPPYICNHVPLNAVRLMTGVHDPIVDGDFDLTVGKRLDGKNYGTGGCYVYQPTGDKPKVLQVSLSPGGSKEEAEWEISQGAEPLPEIIPGAIGYYGPYGGGDRGQAAAVLVYGLDEVTVDLVHGVKGRDSAADVVALMKLIAPKLIPYASAAPEKAED